MCTKKNIYIYVYNKKGRNYSILHCVIAHIAVTGKYVYDGGEEEEGDNKLTLQCVQKKKKNKSSYSRSYSKIQIIITFSPLYFHIYNFFNILKIVAETIFHSFFLHFIFQHRSIIFFYVNQTFSIVIKIQYIKIRESLFRCLEIKKRLILMTLND